MQLGVAAPEDNWRRYTTGTSGRGDNPIFPPYVPHLDSQGDRRASACLACRAGYCIAVNVFDENSMSEIVDLGTDC